MLARPNKARAMPGQLEGTKVYCAPMRILYGCYKSILCPLTLWPVLIWLISPICVRILFFLDVLGQPIVSRQRQAWPNGQTGLTRARY